MPVTMDDVRAQLDPDEVDYAAAAGLGPEALPYLEELARSADMMLASKATYLASLIQDDRSARILEVAAQHPEPAIRVAAAAGLANLREDDANALMDRLIEDGDAGVRKVTVKSATNFASPAMNARLQRVAAQDPEPALRELAERSLQR